MYSQGYSNTEENAVLVFQGNTSLNEPNVESVLSFKSGFIAEDSGDPQPAAGHRRSPSWTSVIPLVCPARKPHGCLVLSKGGQGSGCRVAWLPVPVVASTALPWFISMVGTEQPSPTPGGAALAGIHALNMVQKNDELQMSPLSCSTFISLQ